MMRDRKTYRRQSRSLRRDLDRVQGRLDSFVERWRGVNHTNTRKLARLPYRLRRLAGTLEHLETANGMEAGEQPQDAP